jgi:PAS domain S-box-containing protein
MAGIMLPEIREFCDRNVHPADRTAFMNFYDMSTLDERVRDREGAYDVIVLRARVSPTKYTDHIFTLIPMTVEGRRLVLSTARAIDTGASNSYQVSGDSRISDTVLLKAVLDGIDRYVFWKDDQRRFLGANQAFLDYYGFSSLDAIVGKTDEEVGWHVDNEPFMLDEERVLQGDVVQRARGTCYDRNELRHIEANKRPIEVSGEIVGLLGYFRDLGPAEEERRPGSD